MTRIRVAVAQMCSGTRPESNLATIAALAGEAAAGGASYVLTPEMSVAFAADREGLAQVSEPFSQNSAIAECSSLARRNGLYLHLGSLAVRSGDGRHANRSVLFAPDGEIAATYDKIHLFDADPPGDRPYRESETYRGGDRAVVTTAPGFGLGLTICYDVRFSGLFSTLADAGADVIALPAAFTVPTGSAHWETLVRARAIETGCFIVAAAQAGRHENGRSTYGHSMVVDPWGEILAIADGESEGLIFADIDLEAVGHARRRVPALANRRPFSLSVNPDLPE
ncbi:MAG TPA: carbon-nitrogen hydrolase family protein [Devosiaceae bacterium]